MMQPAKQFLKFFLLVTIPTLCAAKISSYDLSTLYDMAKTHDPTYLAAKANQAASNENLPQARAQFLPTLSALVNTTGNSSTNPVLKKYNTQEYSLSLTQPIIRFSDWIQLKQASNQVKAAHFTFLAAEQDLILRLTEQYFDIAKALDNLQLAKAERIAFARTLEQTEQRFKVGLIAKTDVHEARARHDSAYAQEIAAQNTKDNEYEKLGEIVGSPVQQITLLKKKMPLVKPDPEKITHWVELAQAQNLNLQATRHNLQVTRDQIKREGTSHLPTLVATGNVRRLKGAPPSTDRVTNRDIGISLTIPISNGGNVSSRTRQAQHLYQAAAENHEKTHREVLSNTRQAYRGVFTQISQVNALNQAVISNQSALKATEAAFEVGTRTIVDVLNAQSDLLTAKRDYANARYDYILESLKLKQAAGALAPEDLLAVNDLLDATKS